MALSKDELRRVVADVVADPAVKGEKGDTGAQGPRGPRGVPGETGERGANGPRGKGNESLGERVAELERIVAELAGE